MDKIASYINKKKPMSNFRPLHEEDDRSQRLSSYPSIQMVPIQKYHPVVAPRPVEPQAEAPSPRTESTLRKVVRWEVAIGVVSVLLIVSD